MDSHPGPATQEESHALVRSWSRVGEVDRIASLTVPTVLWTGDKN